VLLFRCPEISTANAGEVAEWKAELSDKHKQKDTLKKIIAAMTIGKDVSAVFAEVTSCSQTTDLELKKLVYLYLINYAKTQPELAIMAVNTFVKVVFFTISSTPYPCMRSFRIFGHVMHSRCGAQ
jgi:AP-1 complex subunit beta-1